MMNMPPINYKRIAEAVEKYTKLGYEYIEVPWMVRIESIQATLPPDCKPIQTCTTNNRGEARYGGYLVGSAEQSFIEIRDQLCPSRKYQTVTPCFRDERVYDDLHYHWFMKLELIFPLWKTDDADAVLHSMIKDAQSAMWGCGPTSVAKTTEGFDLQIRGIEVGSYGIRQYGNFRWVYGTGMAEPRMSQAVAKHKEECEREDDELLKSVTEG